MKYVKLTLFIFGLIGSVAVLLSTFNIQRDFISEHNFYFMVPLWVSIIGLFIIKKYETRKTEKEMMSK
ncbi:hypothetical protein MKZ25_15515 [Solibacillus sp. FSL W7-1464]|uniref:hypothetical protein n=1 Tax=Solibacillus sp. FSL W7-1464 TaxID=2921706 RepID=UPI0030FAD9F3